MGTHFADGYKTYLFDMAPDGKSIDRGSARLVNEGNGREANKLIKVGGWYYLVFSEHKPGIGRYVMARRSRKVTGPYKEEKQLALPGVEAMEPNQGGIVEGRDGEGEAYLAPDPVGTGRLVALFLQLGRRPFPAFRRALPDGVGELQGRPRGHLLLQRQR